MVSKAFDLSGKVALVAGDSRFWSKHIAAALAGAGADVAIAARDAGKVEAAVEEVRHMGKKAIGITADLARLAQVRQMLNKVVSSLGSVDILVNASDAPFARPFAETTKKEWQHVFDANLTPVILCCQAVGERMRQNKKGRIINIVSCLGERGLPNGAAYCTAMGGVVQLTRALELEWARDGITVNAIGTGWFAEKPAASPDDRLLRYLPMKRYGHPSEVGSMVVYLASDATDFVTGQVLYVDGTVMNHL